jgi:hypothetical protein
VRGHEIKVTGTDTGHSIVGLSKSLTGNAEVAATIDAWEAHIQARADHAKRVLRERGRNWLDGGYWAPVIPGDGTDYEEPVAPAAAGGDGGAAAGAGAMP